MRDEHVVRMRVAKILYPLLREILRSTQDDRNTYET